MTEIHSPEELTEALRAGTLLLAYMQKGCVPCASVTPLLRLIDDEADGYHTASIEDTGDHWFTDAWSVDGSPTWLVFRGGEEKSRIDPAGRSAGEPYVNYAMRFSDVHSDLWYAEAIRWAAAEKIVSGFDAEHFAPDDPISREQLAMILYRYSEYTGKDRDISDGGGLDRYADAGVISDWALDAVGWAAANGLILGVSDDIFSPSSYAARAQTAAVLTRYFNM